MEVTCFSDPVRSRAITCDHGDC